MNARKHLNLKKHVLLHSIFFFVEIHHPKYWLPFHSSFTDFLCLSPCSWQCAWSAAVFLALFFAVCPSFPSYPKIATTSTSYPIPSLLSVSLTFLPPFHFLPSVLWIGLCRAVSPWLGLPSSTSRSEGRPEQMVGASLWVQPTSLHWAEDPLNRLSVQLAGTGPAMAPCWGHTCHKAQIPTCTQICTHTLTCACIRHMLAWTMTQQPCRSEITLLYN